MYASGSGGATGGEAARPPPRRGGGSGGWGSAARPLLCLGPALGPPLLAHEGCAASNETVTTLRNLTATAATLGRRLVYQCHGECKIDEVAAFLAGAGPYHYYGCGGWVGTGAHGNFSEHWVEGVFGRRLGAPLADGAYADGVWTRTFRSGTAVRFDAKTGKGKIRWGGEAVEG